MEEKRISRHSRKKSSVNKLLVLSFIAVFGLCLVLIYLMFAQIFYARFLPNTYISGMNISFKTIQDVEKLIDKKIENYKIVIKFKDGEDIIYGRDIGLKRIYGTTIPEFLASQRPIAWMKNLFKPSILESPLPISINESKFSRLLTKKEFMKKSVETASGNIIISEYEPNKGYKMIEAGQEDIVDRELALSYIRSAILKLDDEVDIATEPQYAYIGANAGVDYGKVEDCIDLLNKYISTYIEYKDNFIIDGNHISKWILIDDNYDISFDDTKIGEFVDTLAKSYVIDENINFKTSYGSYVSISGSDYSKIVDKDAEVSKIKELISEAYSGKREPLFSEELTDSESNRYGDTYVEVNLSSQHLFYYKKGELILETDIISGDESRQTATPVGIYRVVEKLGGMEDAVNDVVKFSDTLGFYTKKDVSKFGGSIYKTNGSEGGIMLPKDKLKSLYDNIDNNTMVLCYKLEEKPQAVAESTAASRASETVIESTQESSVATKKKQKTTPKSNQKPKATQVQQPQSPSPTNAPTSPSSTTSIINIPESTKAMPKKEPIRAFRSGPGVETTADPNEVGPGVQKIRPQTE